MRTNGGRVSVELARKREQAAFDLAAAKGLTETQIAAELATQGLGEVTQQAVSKMLLRVEKRMLAEMGDRVRAVKLRQTASLQKIYQEAMAAWEESKKPQKSLTTRHGPSGDNGQPGKVLESQSVLRDQDGDPRYLDQARQALADIRKLWGADAARKLEVTGEDGEPVRMDISVDLVLKAREAAENYRRERLAHSDGSNSAPDGDPGLR
jgi:hypothetical protein